MVITAVSTSPEITVMMLLPLLLILRMMMMMAGDGTELVVGCWVDNNFSNFRK